MTGAGGYPLLCTRAARDGATASRAGRPADSCPHPDRPGIDNPIRRAWLHGHDQAARQPSDATVDATVDAMMPGDR